MVAPTNISTVQEPIYDIPQNNQRVKKLTLYERISEIFSRLCKKISNLFSRRPDQIKVLENKAELLSMQNHTLQINMRDLYQTIYNNIKQIENLINRVSAQEIQINSLKETFLSLEDELYSNKTQVSRSDSGFAESPPTEKKSLFSKIIGK